MAISVMNWVWDHSRSRYGARLTLLALAYHGEVVTISVSELCHLTRLSERGVRMAISELVSLGELAVEFNVGSNSRYRLLMPDQAPLPPRPSSNRRPISPALRLHIYERDGYHCVYCGSTEDLTIDHIYPQARGGTHEEGNLQTLCRPCNCRKGARVLWSGPSCSPASPTTPASRPPRTTVGPGGC